MAGTLSAPPRREIFVVASLIGTLQLTGGSRKKARAWVLEDKSVIIATAEPPKDAITYTNLTIDKLVLSPGYAKLLLDGDAIATMAVKDCNCGMGAVGGARVTKDRHKITRVKYPDWVESN